MYFSEEHRKSEEYRDKLIKVESRLDETLVPFVDQNNNYRMDTGYDVKKIKELCKEEFVDCDDFFEFMQKKAKGE